MNGTAYSAYEGGREGVGKKGSNVIHGRHVSKNIRGAMNQQDKVQGWNTGTGRKAKKWGRSGRVSRFALCKKQKGNPRSGSGIEVCGDLKSHGGEIMTIVKGRHHKAKAKREAMGRVNKVKGAEEV